jgi:hypothetical protein
MSGLLDSFLLEEYRDAREIFIELRKDAQPGSGSANDAWDGGTRLDRALAASLSFGPLEVTAIVGGPNDQAAPNFNLMDGDWVTISGVTGAGASSFNGSFQIYGVTAQAPRLFKYVVPSTPAAGPSGVSVFARKGRQFNVTLTYVTYTENNQPKTDITVTTSPAHDYMTGNVVVLFGCTGAGADFFNGTSTSITKLSSTQFKFTKDGWPAAGPAGSIVCILNSPVLRVGLGRQVTVSTAQSHGYANNDPVSISGAPHTSLQGQFLIAEAANASFKYLAPYDPAASAGGPGLCAKVIHRFDEVLRSLPASPLVIHLGPGTFETRGFTSAPVPTGWQPRSGWRLVGAGVNLTTLRLVDAPLFTQNQVVGANYDNFLSGFEASDLTLDANASGQPKPPGISFPALACNGILVPGLHVRLQRLRLINFGSQHSLWECFGIVSGAGLPSQPEALNDVTADCIAEQPAMNSVRETSLIGMGANSDALSGLVGKHRACVVRHCLVDCTYLDRPVAIESITYAGTTATVKTRAAHNRNLNEWVIMSGALENGVPSTHFNGSFLITDVPDATTFKVTTPAGATAIPTGNMYVGLAPSHPVEVVSAVATHIAPSIYSVLLTTLTPHFRTPANNVNVFGALVSNLLVNAYNGSFPIDEIVSPTQLKYTTFYTGQGLLPAPDAGSLIGIGVFFQGAGASGGPGATGEGNRVFNCLRATNHDTYSSPDGIIRNCLFSGVYVGLLENMGNVSMYSDGVNPPALRLLNALTNAGNTATAETNLAHGFARGDAVQIAEARVGGVTSPCYNGYFLVDSAPDPTHFTYIMAGNPGGPATDARFGQLWQTKRYVGENNLIELLLSYTPYRAPSAGAAFQDSLSGQHPGVYIFGQVFLRHNVIRHVNGVFDPTQRTYGIGLGGTEHGLLESNIINLDTSIPIFYASDSKSVEALNNLSPDGRLLQSANQATGLMDSELGTKVQDALALALL